MIFKIQIKSGFVRLGFLSLTSIFACSASLAQGAPSGGGWPNVAPNWGSTAPPQQAYPGAAGAYPPAYQQQQQQPYQPQQQPQQPPQQPPPLGQSGQVQGYPVQGQMPPQGYPQQQMQYGNVQMAAQPQPQQYQGQPQGQWQQPQQPQQQWQPQQAPQQQPTPPQNAGGSNWTADYPSTTELNQSVEQQQQANSGATNTPASSSGPGAVSGLMKGIQGALGTGARMMGAGMSPYGMGGMGGMSPYGMSPYGGYGGGYNPMMGGMGMGGMGMGGMMPMSPMNSMLNQGLRMLHF